VVELKELVAELAEKWGANNETLMVTTLEVEH